ncbi:MAG: MBOAT family protein [Ruminococcus sp.]|nr:MBOAT family protein [Ruminococcus sp.]
MLFSSNVFLYMFLPLCLGLYFLVPRKLKNFVLLVFSLVFYAWGEPKYVLIMLASITVAFITGLFADQKRYKTNGRRKAMISMIIAIVWNLGFLFFFKYTNLFIKTANDIGGFGIKALEIALPIGISFYSFQTLSYVIDVYKGEVKPQRNILNLATYVALFPQLIAGPIVRYQTIEEQLTERHENFLLFSQGVKRFSYGLAKKVILANSAGALFEELSNMPGSELSVTAAWLGIIAYTFQIFFDFSGYSDMAIGLGKMFGFEFLENFEYPYISKSITEFWRRWHISLSTWFRDYVYIPLGGNRKGKGRQVLNIMIVWALTGFWHGASWNFMGWGVYFGILLLLEKFIWGKGLQKAPAVIQHIYAMFFVVIGWALFAFDDTDKLINNLKNMFGANGLPIINDMTVSKLIGFAVTFVILVIASTPLCKWAGAKIKGKSERAYDVIEVISIPLLLILSAAYLVSSSYNPFLYFRF